MKLIYPAIFYPYELGEGFTVEVPDLPGCVSCGENLAEAIAMATEAASGWVLDELEDNKPIPVASKLKDIQAENDAFVSLLSLDLDAYIHMYGNKSVRKNTTIPAWMDTYVQKNNLNVSKILQEAIEAIYIRQSAICSV